jgi:hypothetical protein
MEYGLWIEHMVKKGYVVVWVQYDAGLVMPWNFAQNAITTWRDALRRLETAPHVRPAKDVSGQIKTAMVGHSAGGYLSAILAAKATRWWHNIPRPYAVVAVEPGDKDLIPGEDFSRIDPATKLVLITGEEDSVVCTATATMIWNETPQISDDNKDFLLVQSDNRGEPEQIANHYFPNNTGRNDTAAIDARDFYVTFKLSVGTFDCAFRGTNCTYALGNGSAVQIDMGKWSNGSAVTPMLWVEDPNELVTVCENRP